jgi:hypothetical protein
VLELAVRIGVADQRQAIAAEPEPVRAQAAQHPQMVVVGVVLHHQHHDVLDLGDGVGARRKLRVGERPGLA